jgi:glycosyltransferase involved in cell wall biosynthesis
MTGVKFYADTPPEGYGVAAHRMMAGLDRLGVPVMFVPEFGAKHEAAGRVQAVPLLARLASRPVAHDTVVFHSSPDHWPRLAAQERGRILVGATAWETDRPPARWLEAARAVHRTIVPCEWNRRVFAAAGWPGPIDVVPHIAQEAADLPPSRPAAGIRLRRDDFVFYSIAVWSARKALGETVAAFCRAARWRRRTILVLKTTALDLTNEIRHQPRVPSWLTARLITLATAPWCRVTLLTGRRPETEMSWLHRRGDCYLNFSRGEGWGLGLFDACVLGKPVISTAHGGPLDYLGDEAWRVGWRAVPVRPRNHERFVYETGMRWAEPDWVQAVRCIRDVCTDPAAARRRAAPAAARLQAACGWRPATERLLGVFARARVDAAGGGAIPS